MDTLYTYVFMFDIIIDEDTTVNHYETFRCPNVDKALDAFDEFVSGKTYRLLSMYRE